MQKGNIKDMKEEEFMAKYEAYVKEMGEKQACEEEAEAAGGASEVVAPEKGQRKPSARKSRSDEVRSRVQSLHSGESNFRNIVLKFTTLSEGCYEAPSFTVDRKGASIGREPVNDISVPSDQRLAAEHHSMIEFTRGSFYIVDGGHLYAASVRIGLNNGHSRKWYLECDARFSAGNSIIQSKGVDGDGNLILFVVEGPLKGDTIKIGRRGATFGRSSENTVCIPDRELSRKHSRVDFDEKSQRYVVNDMGSTNGTYVQLVGPYGGRYKLNLNDHILVGRTGFSINRFDYGLSEEMGYRQSMEDACTIVQHLNIGPLNVPDLSPQSFFGVFDGHGGDQASQYLAQHLHVNVAHRILDEAHNIFEILDRVAPCSIYGESGEAGSSSSNARPIQYNSYPKDGSTDLAGKFSLSAASSANPEMCLKMLDSIVVPALKEAFLKTDQNFISSSSHPQHGSTGTTALILGKRLYCANLGDSRTMMCRCVLNMLISQLFPSSCCNFHTYSYSFFL